MALDFSSLKFMLQLKYYNLLVATEPKNPPWLLKCVQVSKFNTILWPRFFLSHLEGNLEGFSPCPFKASFLQVNNERLRNQTTTIIHLSILPALDLSVTSDIFVLKIYLPSNSRKSTLKAQWKATSFPNLLGQCNF
jgi:hypothetical protein